MDDRKIDRIARKVMAEEADEAGGYDPAFNTVFTTVKRKYGEYDALYEIVANKYEPVKCKYDFSSMERSMVDQPRVLAVYATVTKGNDVVLKKFIGWIQYVPNEAENERQLASIVVKRLKDEAVRKYLDSKNGLVKPEAVIANLKIGNCYYQKASQKYGRVETEGKKYYLRDFDWVVGSIGEFIKDNCITDLTSLKAEVEHNVGKFDDEDDDGNQISDSWTFGTYGDNVKIIYTDKATGKKTWWTWR